MTASRRDCRVTRVETHLVGTRWCNWVFAQVFTDDGITGVGEGTCEWQAKAVEAAIHQLAERHVIGQLGVRDRAPVAGDVPQRVRARRADPEQRDRRASRSRMWDIVGKALDRPVHELLGGRVRERLPAYANAWYGAGADAGGDRARPRARCGTRATAASSSTRSRAPGATRTTR